MGLLEDIDSGKYNLVLFCIFGFLIAHLYWNKSSESMTDVEQLSQDQIKNAIKQIYNADVEAIRNLASVATQLQAGGLTVPGDLTIKGNFSANGTFNLLPKGTIVAFNSDKAPDGWALCDGTNGTPDLRGRFIRMQSDSLGGFNDWGGKLVDGNKMTYNKNLGGNSRDDVKSWILNHKFGDQAGTDQHVLHINELPAHVHKVNDWADWAGGGGQNNYHGNVYHRGAWYAREQDQNGGPENYNALYDSDSAPAGAGWTHNNQPPYYVLSYIMKL